MKCWAPPAGKSASEVLSAIISHSIDQKLVDGPYPSTDMKVGVNQAISFFLLLMRKGRRGGEREAEGEGGTPAH